MQTGYCTAVCRFASTPTKQAWQQCRRIAQYAYNTRHRGVKFTRTTDVSELLSVRAFADASFLDCPDTARSTGGYCVFFCGNLIAFESKRLPLVTLSTADAAFSTPMSVALRRRLPRRRPPCPCCKFTSSTAISTELAINAWWISLHVPPWYPPRYCQTLRHRYQTVFEQRLSAGIRVTSHHGILHDFHHQLLHPAPLMNSPSSSTCSHLLLVTSSHLDFPGGVMNRLSSPVGVLAP